MRHLLYALTLVCGVILSSCALPGGIFKAGMIWGIFLVVAIIGLILYMISRSGK